MSSFKGRMGSYPNICIDRFDGTNLRCTAFFLSHCHKDHMTGLDDKKFETAIKSRSNVFLYCSEITRLLLLADEEYKPLEKAVRVLEVGSRHLIKIPNDHVDRGGGEIAVTPISAGHCPGSVMFLFEGDKGTSLYTGDFRWEPNYSSTVTAFHTNDRVKEIDHLYIDSTFCVPAAMHIPSRVECAEATVSVVASWLERSPLHQVAFFCPAKYGYEFLLRELATRLGVKIHVSPTKFSLYEQIPDLSGLFTSDPMNARVHACSPKLRTNSSSLPPCLSHAATKTKTDNKNDKTHQVLNIRPCAMWFTTKAGREALKRLTPLSPRGLQRVCYSMHSSYSEIQDLVSYLQPRHVWPNVIPASDHGPEQVQDRLNSFLEKSHPLRPRPPRAEEVQPKPIMRNLDLVNTVRRPQTSSLFRFVPNDSDSSEGCVFDSQSSTEDKALTPDMTGAKDYEKTGQPEPLDIVNLEKEEQLMVCPDTGGEEADSDLHLRLSQDSDSSQDSHQTQDTSQDSQNSKSTQHTPETPKKIGHPGDISLGLHCSYSTVKEKQGLECGPVSEKASESPNGRMEPGSVSQTDDTQDYLGKTHSPEFHKEYRVNCDEVSSKAAGQNIRLDSKPDQSEVDSDVINSSPVSQTKKFTSFLKGRPVKISPGISSSHPKFSNFSVSGHQQKSPKQSSTRLQSISGQLSQSEPPMLSVKRQLLTTQEPDLLESHVQKSAINEIISHHTRSKKQRLSPGSECVHGVIKSDCISSEQKNFLAASDSNPISKRLCKQNVYVIPSDSEETDEDSEKLLISSSSTGLKLKTNHSDFIDLTKDT